MKKYFLIVLALVLFSFVATAYCQTPVNVAPAADATVQAPTSKLAFLDNVRGYLVQMLLPLLYAGLAWLGARLLVLANKAIAIATPLLEGALNAGFAWLKSKAKFEIARLALGKIQNVVIPIVVRTFDQQSKQILQDLKDGKIKTKEEAKEELEKVGHAVMLEAHGILDKSKDELEPLLGDLGSAIKAQAISTYEKLKADFYARNSSFAPASIPKTAGASSN